MIYRRSISKTKIDFR